MMSSKKGVGQVIETFVTIVTLVALTGRLRVIKAALDDLFGLTRWASDTIWPAQLTDGLITLDIIDEILDIDLHGGLLSEIVEWDVVSLHHPQIHDPGIQYERYPFVAGTRPSFPVFSFPDFQKATTGGASRVCRRFRSFKSFKSFKGQ
jgi:hypothetical protein